jgi:Restriction Enzyme Adenine Methylase Associated
MQLGRSPVSLSDLIQAGLLRSGQRLLFRRRPECTAEVTDRGTLLFDNREFKSPSTAALAAGGSATNGWLAWYSDEGALTHLGTLRERALSGSSKTPAP